MIGTQEPCRQGLDLHGSAVTETQRSRKYQIYQLLLHVQCKHKQNLHKLALKTKMIRGQARGNLVLSHASASSKGFNETAHLRAIASRIHKTDKGSTKYMHRSRVGTPPLKNQKNIGYLSNTDPDPLKNYKATTLLELQRWTLS